MAYSSARSVANMASSRRQGSSSAAASAGLAVVALIVLAGLGLLVRWLFPHWLTGIYSVWTLGTPFWVHVFWTLVIIAAVGYALVLGITRMFKTDINSGTGAFAGVIVAVLGIGAFWVLGAQPANRSDFDALRNAGAATQFVDGSPTHTYKPRLSSLQADQRLSRLTSDQRVAHLTDANFTAYNGEPAWCAGGLGVDDSMGRQSVRVVVCLVEATDGIKTAEFNGRVPTTNGNFSTSLSRSISQIDLTWSAADEDVYFYIEDDKPNMGVVTTTVEGDPPHTVTAGIVIWDQEANQHVYSNAKRGQFPFPTVAYAEARDIRKSLNTHAGFWCWNGGEVRTSGSCTKNGMYESTDATSGNAAMDPNADNPTEHVVHTSDGRLVMLTPLTNYGRSRSVVAFLEVYVDELTFGSQPETTLYKLDKPLSPPVYVAEKITGTFTADLSWVTEVNEDAATSAFRIYEITPLSATEYTATIGTATTPSYRVIVNAVSDETGEFGDIVVYRFRDNQKIVTWNPGTDGIAPVGTLVGVTSNEPSEPGTEVTGSDLSQIPTADLLAEICRRLKQPSC